ncbi:MAG: 50S ribosomal protein L21 [Chromatiales bacterium]|nr:50S ribosomal protein L21 [Chromatiales bacterium]
MYAVFRTGGKQYRASPGDKLKVEKLPGAEGETILFDQVLMVGGEGEPSLGSPRLEGASVTGKVLRQDRDDKIMVIKFKRRKNYRRTRGHRQPYTLVEITGINAG